MSIPLQIYHQISRVLVYFCKNHHSPWKSVKFWTVIISPEIILSNFHIANVDRGTWCHSVEQKRCTVKVLTKTTTRTTVYILGPQLLVLCTLTLTVPMHQITKFSHVFCYKHCCGSWSIPKLGNCLEMYTCAQASAQFVHSMCTSLNTPCTLELLLGHFLYTGGVYILGALTWAHVYISKQFPSLGTPTFTAVKTV